MTPTPVGVGRVSRAPSWPRVASSTVVARKPTRKPRAWRDDPSTRSITETASHAKTPWAAHKDAATQQRAEPASHRREPRSPSARRAAARARTTNRLTREPDDLEPPEPSSSVLSPREQRHRN